MKYTNCFRITATDSTVVRLTDYPYNLTMSNDEIYYSSPTTTVTERSIKLDNSPLVVDFGSVYDLSYIARDEVHSRKWDGATVRYFTTDWSNPVEDETPVSLMTLGKIREQDGRFVAELMGQKDKLNTIIGDICTPTCQKIFTDTHIDGENIIVQENWTCGVSYSANVFGATITSVTNDYTFSSTDLISSSFPDDWFGNGELLFLYGSENVGLGRRIVDSFTADTGTIVLDFPLYYPPSVGESFELLTGCRKRYAEDCVAKFSNGVNFGGFAHVPVGSSVVKRGKR